MSTSVAIQQQEAMIAACTVSRDVQKFDLLIEDMETELGEAWGDLSFEDARLFLAQPDAASLEFVALAIDEEDEDNLAIIADVVLTAKKNGLKVILIAEDVSTIALHQLLRLGAQEFVPYPLPEGALHEAIERLNAPPPANIADEPARKRSAGDRDGAIIAIQGMAGGVGATTLATNLAWELAGIQAETPPQVCLLDLDFQHGSVATYLDLPRRDVVFEILSDMANMDDEAFNQALLTFNEKLRVLTAPADMIPLDLLSQEDVTRLLDTARKHFDYVVVDLPKTIVQWTETVLTAAHVYLAPLELEMRSAQNTLRLVRALKAEELPYEKLRFILNRAPKFTDMQGRARVKRMAESLDISLDVQLPDGGRQVMQSGDHGMPLAETAPKNPLRKEIHKLAVSLHEHAAAAAEA